MLPSCKIDLEITWLTQMHLSHTYNSIIWARLGWMHVIHNLMDCWRMAALNLDIASMLTFCCLLKKKYGMMRMRIDFITLNANTIFKIHPITCMDHLMSCFNENKVFSKIYLRIFLIMRFELENLISIRLSSKIIEVCINIVHCYTIGFNICTSYISKYHKNI